MGMVFNPLRFKLITVTLTNGVAGVTAGGVNDQRGGAVTLNVVNKIDAVVQPGHCDPDTFRSFRTFSNDGPVCLVSCKSGDGVAKLMETIEAEVARLCDAGLDGDIIFCNERHRAHLQKCIDALDEILQDPTDVVSVAENLRYAASQFGCITGRIDFEKVLDSIFRDFCIGK